MHNSLSSSIADVREVVALTEQMLDTGCRMQDAGSRIQGHSMRATVFIVPAKFEYGILSIDRVKP
jgi:hypothetical protein